MNFSFSMFLVSLSFPFVSCEKCFEALHETFKKDFNDVGNCDDCVILSPKATFLGENWTGFCIGAQTFLFPDWKCRTNNHLLNPVSFYAVVTKESCELKRENRDLNEKCVKMYNDRKCNEKSVEMHLGVRGSDRNSFPLTVLEGHSRGTTPPRWSPPTTTETSSTEETSTQTTRTIEKTTTESSTTAETETTETTEETTTESSTTEETETIETTEETTTESSTTEETETTKTTEETTTESSTTEETETTETTEETTTDSSTTEETETTKATEETTTKISTTERETVETFIPAESTAQEYSTSFSATKPRTQSSTKKDIISTRSTSPENDFSSTTIPYPSIKKTCEWNEFFYNDHCYFVKKNSINSKACKSNPTKRCFNIAKICKSQHPKALGLAVETKEENDFIIKKLANLDLKASMFITSGVRENSSIGEWKDWNLEINDRILNLKEDRPSININLYCIDAVNYRWFLSSQDEPKLKESFFICERPYNPKNVELELHELCLQLYRNSSCSRLEEHTNYCCEKDEKGEIWFACSGKTDLKKYPNCVECTWKCTPEGFFEKDRPICRGQRDVCVDWHNEISFMGVPFRYAIGDCPSSRSGFSTWFCGPNKKFLKTPDYSLCCENNNTPHCRDTDIFLNTWIGCPSKKIVKTTPCPPGSDLQEATVEWFCQANGTFYGSRPDYSNCNTSNVICKKKDSYGTEWVAEAGTTAKKNCPPHFNGQCFWKCKQSGKFDGLQPDCSHCKADWMDDVADKIRNQTDHEAVMEIMENYTKNGDLRIGYGHVLNLTAACVLLYKKQTSDCQFCVFEKFLKSYSKILKNVAGNPDLWSSFSEPNRREFTDKIFLTTQTAAFANLESTNGTCQHYNQTFAKSEQDGFDFFVAYNPSVGSRFPLENFVESNWNLDIKEIKEENVSYAAMGLVMSYSLSTLMFPQGNETVDLEVNAPAITFTVAASRNGEIVVDPNVVVSVSFKHINKTRLPATSVIKRRLHEGEQPSGVFNSTLCFYYRDTDWSTEGCYVTYTSSDKTNCTCNHLSTIGLLMSVHKYEPNLTMEVISTVNSGITIFSLILALLVFFFVDKAKNDRVLIGKNLCFCLLVGHSLLITVMDKKFFNIPDNFCTVYAVLLHYVFMAAFAWMFVEGCHLYRMLILVFDSNLEYRLIYLAIGYGMPLVIVVSTYGVGFILQEQPYGQDELCWLKTPKYIWAFVGPVIFLTSINFCILIMAMRSAISSRRKMESTSFLNLILWKGWISLSALLGITWLFGFAFITYNEPLMYAFIFCNGLQGLFIFIFRCVLCEQYKTVFLKKLKSWFSTSKSKNQKKVENVKSETKVYAISGSKSLTESKDSGYEPGMEDRPKCLKKTEKKKNDNSPSEVDSDITLSPAMSEAYLRNRMIAKNFSARKSKAKWLSESENFPELSFHDIPN